MGIAGFFLWLQRWYAECIDEIPQAVVDAALSNDSPLTDVKNRYLYDNFYVDMNGLIHPCCHDTAPLPEPETEEEMFERMFQQLDLLVKVVRPRKCLVLCVDGVAPRSKMNQQRSRRFRAAEERLESDALGTECADRMEREYKLCRPRVRDRWDHNLITPSTAFMERVGLAVEWFVMKKLNEDPSWKHLAVVFSDAHVAGEGEHKIMHYIRGLRAQPGYDPNTSHVIHGMDADLVCLGLSTHEEHVSILRNQLTETFQPDHNRFCYFNLYKYRSALKRDFQSIERMSFERVIDDFVFLCFFVGNDFLPHVPLISIKTKGIELLLDHYTRDFAQHSYLTKGGEVNYQRLHIFLGNFVRKSMGKLQNEYRGVVRAKERAKSNVEDRVQRAEKEIQELLEAASNPDATADDAGRTALDDQQLSDKIFALMTGAIKERRRLVADLQPLSFSYLESDYRDKYYAEKFDWDVTDRPRFEANIKLCCAEYLRGMQWVMRYYTKGCPSWEWYYPFHYAPLLQDMALFNSHVDVEMKISAPLHPVEQLLAVLPRHSVHALPEELHEAVNDPASVLGKFYPDRVDVDYSEANFSYQGVLRIPFINCRALHESCQELVELEEDVGTTLLMCHETSPLSQQVERLINSTPNATSTSLACLSYTVVPITSSVASIAPVAGRVGNYEAEWPLHAKLDCPDPGIAKETSYGSPVFDNAVHCFRYELNTHADYMQELLGKRRHRVRSRSPRSSHHRHHHRDHQKETQKSKHTRHRSREKDPNRKRSRHERSASSRSKTDPSAEPPQPVSLTSHTHREKGSRGEKHRSGSHHTKSHRRTSEQHIT